MNIFARWELQVQGKPLNALADNVTNADLVESITCHKADKEVQHIQRQNYQNLIGISNETTFRVLEKDTAEILNEEPEDLLATNRQPPSGVPLLASTDTSDVLSNE